MQGIIFNNLEDVQTFQNQIDSGLGYPFPGENIGSGPFVSSQRGQTKHVSRYLVHPTMSNMYVYIVWDGMFDLIPEGYTIIDLAPEWFPSLSWLIIN